MTRSPAARRRRRIGFGAIGVLLVATGLLMPRAWYEALPTNPEIPAPALSGVTLLQWVLAIQGVLLVWLAFKGFTYRRLGASERLAITLPRESAGDVGARTSLWLLAAITLLALFLRCLELGSDFWIDEVRATLDTRELSALAVFGSYVRSNVHMLNTLLMKLTIGALGESEWSARLPAVVFGTASVPALYWVGRLVLTRGTSLGAALLLAVSYHHVFFSQNARGYALYLFFSLVSSALLVRGLADDRARTWILYVATTVLNFASILISGFVFAAHLVVGAAAIVVVRLRGRSARPLLHRLLVVFGTSGLLGFQLYSVQLPQVIAYVDATYVSPAAGYAFFSVEFVSELARGLSAGFGPGLLFGAIPFLLLAMIGFVAFVRRQWTLAAALTLPLVLTAATLVLRGLTVSPRFFLLGLPVAALTAALMVDLMMRAAAQGAGWGTTVRSGATAAVFVLLAAGSVASLRGYYAVPKQPYRASLEYGASLRGPSDVILALHAAGSGSTYYGPQMGLLEGRDLFRVDSAEALDSVLSSPERDGAVLLTTMPRALHLNRPELEERIREDWRVARTFPATIGDGQISVWVPRSR